MIFRLSTIFFILLIFLLFSIPKKNQSIIRPPGQNPKFFNITKPQLKFEAGISSIDQIFSDNHKWTATLSAEMKRTLIATGDVIPARSVNFQMSQLKNFKWPFEKTFSVLDAADLAFINLESPLIKNCPVTQVGMKFCGDPRSIEGLVLAGVDVVNLANNHSDNYGQVGINDTIDLLKTAGILATGVSGPVFKEVRGLKFAFLGYSDISCQGKLISCAIEEKITEEISKAKEEADIVVVTFHWGIEYQSQPDLKQRKLAHLAIDSGADLVIGNHPHWIQPVEIYKGKLITYAHGNFVFDQMWSQKTLEGVVGRYTFYDRKLIDVEFLPIKIQDFGQPDFITDPSRKGAILTQMKEESLKLSSSTF